MGGVEVDQPGIAHQKENTTIQRLNDCSWPGIEAPEDPVAGRPPPLIFPGSGGRAIMATSGASGVPPSAISIVHALLSIVLSRSSAPETG